MLAAIFLLFPNAAVEPEEPGGGGITDNTWLWGRRGKITKRRKEPEPIAPEEYDDEITVLLMVA